MGGISTIVEITEVLQTVNANIKVSHLGLKRS